MMSLRLLACAGVVASAPNIVVFLTDDQDVMLGGAFPTLGDATPMPRTRELLVERGATFTGMMVHTPICSPSRAELLTGRLLHNLKTTGGTLWQMHLDEERVHNYTFAAPENYSTAVIGNLSLAWLEAGLAAAARGGAPS